MKLWTFCCLLTAVVARRQYYPGEVQTLKYVNDNTGIDGFNYEFEQSDGTKAQARGHLVKVIEDGKELSALVIEGSYSFVNKGVTYTVRYVADQNGYHPTVAVVGGGVPAVPGYPTPGQPGTPGLPSYPGVHPGVIPSLLG